MALSSYFATPHLTQPSEANNSLPVFIAHGTQDPMLPEALGRQSMEHVRELDYDPVYKTYAMGHEVCMEEIRAIGEWIRPVLGY